MTEAVAVCKTLGWRVTTNGEHTYIVMNGSHHQSQKGCRLPICSNQPSIPWNSLMRVFGSRNGFGQKKVFKEAYLRHIGKI